MMNNEIKMPANFAAIDENEMVYLQGGATTEATAWDVFLNVGKLFNYIARVFSAGSSIVNNIKCYRDHLPDPEHLQPDR